MFFQPNQGKFFRSIGHLPLTKMDLVCVELILTTGA